ncbi:hypothetical protein AQUCO_08300102v1 [Aquilegia coerulea]|uniref:Uncharacterized protein n=1 Tax=Aquilegia coerulea TaxID=218851 RepID=A0A2G5C7C4_AQUCA|nr:hypothetical protein AQUCO_08300102v1 [Aquilegia coerulea]
MLFNRHVTLKSFASTQFISYPNLCLRFPHIRGIGACTTPSPIAHNYDILDSSHYQTNKTQLVTTRELCLFPV